MAVQLLIFRIDIVDAIECCRCLLRIARFFFERSQLLECRGIPTSEFPVFGENTYSVAFVSLRQISLRQKLVDVCIIYVVWIKAANLIAFLANAVVLPLF